MKIKEIHVISELVALLFVPTIVEIAFKQQDISYKNFLLTFAAGTVLIDGYLLYNHFIKRGY